MWKIFTPADGSVFEKPDAILGPVCKNAVEPALRYAEVHNVSVITPGAQGAAFDRGDGFSERVESRVHRTQPYGRGAIMQLERAVGKIEMLESFCSS